MATADVPSRSEPEAVDLRSSARKALDFERRYLRRRWAAYYAAWALAFTLLLGVPYWAGAALTTAVGAFGAFLTYAVLDVTVIALAVPVSVAMARRGERIYDLRGAVAGGRARTGGETLLRVVIVAVAVVGLLVGAAKFGLGSVWTIVVPVFAFIVLTYRSLARSFRPIPVEGWVAVASFVAANSLTLLIPWFARSTALVVLAWEVALGIWAVCAGVAWFAFAPETEGHE